MSERIGDHHELRKRVAQGIIRCANGKTTLGALTEAGERALTRLDTIKKRSA